MFTENKYCKVYFSIITNAMSRANGENTVSDTPAYYERHHIIPKSLGGSNSTTNLVKLTGREHFICHQLLIRFTKGDEKRKMVFALMRMFRSKNGIHCSHISASQYERLKIMWSTAQKEMWANQDYRERIIKKMKESWTDDRKLKFSKTINEIWNNPEKRLEASHRSKNFYLNNGNRIQASLIQLALHKANPEIGKKKARPGEQNGMFGNTHTKVVKEIISKNTKKSLANRSYVEIYGDKKANELKLDRSKKLKTFIKNNPEVRTGGNNPNAKQCLITSPSGDTTTVSCLKTFCKENSISYWGLGETVRGNQSTYNGWIATYLNPK
jgi:hypothetical protein